MMVAAPGAKNVQRPAFAAGAAGNLGITYYASADPDAQTLSAYVTQTKDALDASPLFYSGAINDTARPIFHDYGLSGGSPRLDFVGGAYDSAGTSFWAGDQFTGDVKKIDLATGNVLVSFNTNNNAAGADLADGIAIQR